MGSMEIGEIVGQIAIGNLQDKGKFQQRFFVKIIFGQIIGRFDL